MSKEILFTETEISIIQDALTTALMMIDPENQPPQFNFDEALAEIEKAQVIIEKKL
jgi:hypothetical protein